MMHDMRDIYAHLFDDDALQIVTDDNGVRRLRGTRGLVAAIEALRRQVLEEAYAENELRDMNDAAT